MEGMQPPVNAAQRRAVEAGDVFAKLLGSSEAVVLEEPEEEIALDTPEGLSTLMQYAEDRALNAVYEYNPETLEVTYHCSITDFVHTDTYDTLRQLDRQLGQMSDKTEVGEEIHESDAVEVQGLIDILNTTPVVLEEPEQVREPQDGALEEDLYIEEFDPEQEVFAYIGRNPDVPVSTKSKAYQLLSLYESSDDPQEQAEYAEKIRTIVNTFKESDESTDEQVVSVPHIRSKTLVLSDESDEGLVQITQKLRSTASASFDPQTAPHSAEVALDLAETHQVIDNLQSLREVVAEPWTAEGKTQDEIDAYYRVENLNFWRNKTSELLNNKTVDENEQSATPSIRNPFTPHSVVSEHPVALPSEEELIEKVRTPLVDTQSVPKVVESAEVEKAAAVKKAEQQKEKMIAKSVLDFEGLTKMFFGMFATESPYAVLGDELFDDIVAAADTAQDRTVFIMQLNQKNVDHGAFQRWMDRVVDIEALGITTEGRSFKEVIDEYIAQSYEHNNAQLDVLLPSTE